MDKNTSAVDTTVPPSNAFGRLLSEFRNGQSLSELTAAMQTCVEAARDSGKAAEIKYTLRMEPSGGAMIITDKIETKLPKADREKAIFFPTEQNTLSRKNEAQREFELREVQRVEAAPLREAVRATAAVAS